MQALFCSEAQLSYFSTVRDDSDAPVVVHIHGLGCNNDWFGDSSATQHLLALAQCEWIVPALYGYGLSATHDKASSDQQQLIETFSMARQGERVFQLLRTLLTAQRRVFLIGHSMGGPVAVHVAERQVAAAAAADDDAAVFQLLALVLCEGNVNEDDCFGSGKNAALSLSEFRERFEARVASELDGAHLLQRDPNVNALAQRQTGAATVWASSVALVAESKAALMLARFRALRDAHVQTVFVIGELNRGLLSSEQALRDAGFAQAEITRDTTRANLENGSVCFIADTPHAMHYASAKCSRIFWNAMARLLLLVDGAR